MHLTYKIINKLYLEIYNLFSFFYVKFVIKALKIKIGNNYKINGFPRFVLKSSSVLSIGNSFTMNSGQLYNAIGRNQRCIFSISDNAILYIGNNVGVSSVAIICQKKIIIGNNVKIGGGTVIYDTNFHSLNYVERTSIPEITINIQKRSVTIGNNVFIGGHSIILKGSTIGDNSIIAAGSVVSANIPPDQVWGGSPVKWIKNNEPLK